MPAQTGSRTEAPEGEPTGALFYNCVGSSQRSGSKNFILFSTNRMPLIPLHRILRNMFCAAHLKLFDYKTFLFYNCLYSIFAFYAHYYDTSRYANSFVIGSDHCISDSLT